MTQGQLMLLSGGGFSTETNSYIDQVALNLCQNKGKKRIVFVPTASHDAQGYIDKFKEAFSEHETYVLKAEDLEQSVGIEEMDIIYIGGGDPHYLVETWKTTGFDKIIIKCLAMGILVIGISAGAMCWFEKMRSEKKTTDGLGLLEGSLCPHYDEKCEETLDYDIWAKENPAIKHIKLNNNENLHVIDGTIMAKISSLS